MKNFVYKFFILSTKKNEKQYTLFKINNFYFSKKTNKPLNYKKNEIDLQ